MSAPLAGKTALVTGGTAGVGRETAVGLARLGAAVVVVGPERAQGEAAVQAIRARGAGASVELLVADLTALDQVRWLAERFGSMHPRLDVLVHASSRVFDERRETVDGHEATLAAAHLAPALLTHLLLPRLRASVPARIVNVASGAHLRARIRWDDLAAERGYRAADVFARAALLNLTWTYELARRLRGTGITVVAADPGAGWTGMADAATPALLPAPLRLAEPLVRRLRGAVTVEEAGRPALVAATSREVESGAYLDPRGEPGRPAAASRDGEAALRAWETTAHLLGIPLDRFGVARLPRQAARTRAAAANRARSGWPERVYAEPSPAAAA